MDMTLEEVANEMFLALNGIQVIAEQNVNDICASKQEGGELSAMDRLDLNRWGAVGQAIEKYSQYVFNTHFASRAAHKPHGN